MLADAIWTVSERRFLGKYSLHSKTTSNLLGSHPSNCMTIYFFTFHTPDALRSRFFSYFWPLVKAFGLSTLLYI